MMPGGEERGPLHSFVMPGPSEARRMLGNISLEPVISREPRSHLEAVGGAVISPFVFTWERQDRFYAYHALTQKRLYGDLRLKEIFDFLGTAPGRRSEKLLEPQFHDLLWQVIPALRMDQFLTDADLEPRALIDSLRRSPLFERTDFHMLYLLITHQCNLRCSYCAYLPAALKPPAVHTMSIETARSALALFEDLQDDDASSPSLILYGGEPLLNWETLSNLVREVRAREEKGGFRGKRVAIDLFTNGTVVTRAHGRFLKDHGVRALVSLDGMEHHHDAMRSFAFSGRGSFKRALKGYHSLRESGVMTSVSCTVGTHNLPYLREIVLYFHSLGVSDIHFYPVKGLPDGNIHEIPSRSFVSEIIRLWPLFREMGIRENILLDRVLQMKDEQCHFFDCEAYGGMLAVAPDGSLSPCINMAEEYRCLWGRVEDRGIREIIRRGEMTAAWRRRSPLLMDECLHCIGLGSCGGGCAHEAFVKKGSISSRDPRQCDKIPGIIRWAVEVLGEKEGIMEP
jgi:uncharacterized protein